MRPLVEALIGNKNVSKASTHATSFNRNDLVLGSVVMFHDNTFGMYVPKENYNLVRHLEAAEKPADYFVCYDSESEDDAPAFVIEVKYFNDDLTYNDSSYDFFNIERIYFDIVPKNKISEFLNKFIIRIKDFVDRKEFIER